MERRYLLDVNDPEIFIDTENNDQMLNAFEVKDILNEQNEKIKELNEQLRLAKLGENFEQEKKNNACKLLNEQNEKIKKLKRKLAEKEEELKYARYPVARILDDLNQLKQSQNSKAIEELEKVKYLNSRLNFGNGTLNEYIDTLITELQS